MIITRRVKNNYCCHDIGGIITVSMSKVWRYIAQAGGCNMRVQANTQYHIHTQTYKNLKYQGGNKVTNIGS